MEADLYFDVEDVFEITGRGLVIVGVSESQWNVIRNGDRCEIDDSRDRHSTHPVIGVEIPNWIKKPENPRYGILISRGGIADKRSLVGAQARIIPNG